MSPVNLVFVFLATSFSIAHAQLEHERDAPHLPNEALVRFVPSAEPGEIAWIEARYALRRIDVFDHIGVVHYAIAGFADTVWTIEDLNREPAVEFAEFNFIRQRASWSPPASGNYSKQWHLRNYGQRVNATEGTQQIDIFWEEAMRQHDPKAEIIVAVLDSGVALDHPTFWNRDWNETVLWWNDAEEVDGRDTSGNGYVDDVWGWNSNEGNNFMLDENGHGTAVASIIAGYAHPESGLQGVAPNARIMAVRVMDERGMTSDAAWIAGSRYAIRNGARILNLSFGGYQWSLSTLAHMGWMEDQDVLVVAAAGNDSTNNDTRPSYPASYAVGNLISVAAIDQHGHIAPFSNYGKNSVHLAAPGSNMFVGSVTKERFMHNDFSGDVSDWVTGPLPGNQSSHTHWRIFTDSANNLSWITDSLDPWGSATSFQYNTRTYVASPVIDLTNRFNASASFDMVYELARFWFEYASNGLRVEVGVDKEGWEDFGWEYADYISGWTILNHFFARTFHVDLSRYAGKKVRVRFSLQTGWLSRYTGVYITNFEASAQTLFSYSGREYKFQSGTSFAAPVVAGVAAMIWSEKPYLRADQVRDIVMGSAMLNESESLEGRLLYEGSVDADYAMQITERFNASLEPIAFEVTHVDEYWRLHEYLGFFHAPFGRYSRWVYNNYIGWTYMHYDDERSSFWYSRNHGWYWCHLDAAGWLFAMQSRRWVRIDRL